jgi:hypothetical protein
LNSKCIHIVLLKLNFINLKLCISSTFLKVKNKDYLLCRIVCGKNSPSHSRCKNKVSCDANSAYLKFPSQEAKNSFTTYRCPILESMELILIGKIGKFPHEKCKSVFWTYVRRIVPLVIRRIILPRVYHGKIIFSREIRLSNVTLLLIDNCVCKRKKWKNSLQSK